MSRCEKCGNYGEYICTLCDGDMYYKEPEKIKKTSWDYEKARNSKQMRLVFNMDDPVDAQIFHYLERFKPNRTSYIKRLIYDELVRCAYEQA